MKKTISIHIKGINFLMEEDAYEILKDYLNRLEMKLNKVNGKEDILEDIELRVVELFSIRLSSRKEVIEEKDVRETISTLGEPEQFIEEEDSSQSQTEEKKETYNSENANFESTEKHLYRDVENASIAGVCAGLASYLKIDKILVRVLFILFTLAAGFGVPLYIILWIVLPTAKSHIDRLRMQGRPITVESVREEVELAAERMTRSSQKFANNVERNNVIQNFFSAIGKIISKGFGIFLLFLGIVMSIGFFILFFSNWGTTPVKTNDGYLGLYNFGLLFFEDPEQLNYFWITGSILAVAGIIWLIASGTRLLFNLRFTWYRHLSKAMFFVAIIAVILSFYFGSIVAREYSMEKYIEKEIMVSKTPISIITEKEKYHHNSDFVYSTRRHEDFWLQIQNNRIEERGVRITYEVSPDSLFHIIEEKKSNSRNERQALRRAKNIEYKAKQNGSSITLPNRYYYPLTDKIRNQHIHVYVQIPEGQSVNVNGEFVYPNRDETEWE